MSLKKGTILRFCTNQQIHIAHYWGLAGMLENLFCWGKAPEGM